MKAMGKKVIITGATGMIGKGVLLECLDHDQIDEVLVIGRSLTGVSSPKLKELLIQDFGDYSGYMNELNGFDAAYLCMGVSAGGMSTEKYTEITYDYTLALANTLYDINPSMTITYVSGVGTDSAEKSRSMWARVKGKTENDLLAKGFGAAYMFRPGAIIPERGIKSKTKSYQFMYDYFMWLIKLVKKWKPNEVVNTTQIGLAMINVTLNGVDKDILFPPDIIEASGIS